MEIEAVARVRRLARNGEARRVREQAGLSLAELARELGVDPSTLYRWEVGTSRPGFDAALRWDQVLGRLSEVVA